MNEKLLQYIWQNRYYRTGSLFTTDLQEIDILFPGSLNLNQGPDFQDARIRMGGTTWVGHVELHVKSSDWNLHGHSDDLLYGNVILHVVWLHDKNLQLPFPTLELHGIVPKILLNQYDQLMQSGRFIPCEKLLLGIEPLILAGWKEKLLLERMQNKAWLIDRSLQKNRYHWEESFWHFLARNFGYPVNQDLFLAVAESIPVKWLSKYKKQPLVIEALLLGQAGLLGNTYADEYPNLLQREYRFLQKKYGLSPVYWPVQFLRMRPANFPTIRLAQLAALVHRSSHLFSVIRDTETVGDARKLFRVSAHSYWSNHYLPDQPATHSQKILGGQMADNILINTIIPFLFTYGWHNRQDQLVERSIRWLKEMPAEKNRILRGFESVGVQIAHAADSQSLLFLKKNYCDQKRCLQCEVGKKLLKVDCLSS